MKSDDYMSGYKDGINAVIDKVDEALDEITKYSKMKSFKGIAKRDVVLICWSIFRESVDEFRGMV